MKKILYFIIIAFLSLSAVSQEICNNGIDDDGDGLIDLNDNDCNCSGFGSSSTIPSLIPNPSFEQMNCCPSSYSQMSCASTWVQASDATSDYMNTCGFVMGAASDAGLVPPPDGNGFVGAIYSDGWQEYVGACLSTPMQAGTSYTIKFNIASAPITGWGQTCNGGQITYGPIDITIYGTPTCSDLPFSGTDCPSNHGQWQVLGYTNYTPQAAWSEIEITFTPSFDVAAIIIGSPCSLPSSYSSGSCYPYFYYDNLILNQTDIFGSIDITSSGHLCTNNLVLYSHANLPGTWQWYLNGVALVGQTDSILNVSALGLGNGTYQARLSNQYGCDTAAYVVNVSYPSLTLDNVTNVLCYGGNNGAIDITESGGVSPFTYTWTGPNGFSSTQEDLTNIYAGDYHLTLTDVNGCTANLDATVTQPDSLSMNYTKVDELCPGYSDGSIDITTSGGTQPYTYSWTGPNGFTSTNEDITGLSAGQYSLTITDANGCTLNRNIQIVTLHPTPTSDFTIDSTWCYHDTVAAIYTGNASDSANFHWDFDGANILSGSGSGPINLYWPLAGYYDVSLWVEEYGCYSDTTTAQIMVPQLLDITMGGTDLSCYHDGSGSVYCNVNGGIPPYQYDWNNGTTGTDTLNYVQAGVYQVTVTDSRGCKWENTYVVNEPPLLQVFLPDTVDVCNGQSVTITSNVIGGTEPYTYTWNGTSGENILQITPLSSYDLWLVVRDSHGCTDSAKVYLNVSEPLHMELSVSRDSVCRGDKVILSANYWGGAGQPYFIYDDNGDVVTLPLILPIWNDTTFIIHTKDVCGSIASDTVPVSIYPMPFVRFISDTIEGCQPLPVNFTIVQGAEHLTSYIWNFGDNDNENLSLGANPYHLYNDYGVFTVTLMYVTDRGCKDTVSVPDMIIVYKKPKAEFVNKPEVGTIVNPTIDFINTSEDNIANFWSFGDGDSSIQVNPRHEYPRIENIYQAMLIVESDRGCKDTAIKDIKIKDIDVFYAPTAFTPDNDGINDRFYVVIRNIDTKEPFFLGVYDRWGELIWQTDKYDPENPSKYSWDGMVKDDKPAPPDVYVWRCIYKSLNNKGFTKTGKVTLIR